VNISYRLSLPGEP